MSENLASSNVLFCPQPEDLQLAVSEEERNQNIFKDVSAAPKRQQIAHVRLKLLSLGRFDTLN